MLADLCANGTNDAYAFDRDGISIDEEGLNLRDLDAAQAEAARALGDMARDAARTFKGSKMQQMAIEVRDDTGQVMQVRISFEVKRKS
jgi:predicted regulator of Ras-like GTPase activity (Roadblock/LC7/MglB family)